MLLISSESLVAGMVDVFGVSDCAALSVGHGHSTSYNHSLVVAIVDVVRYICVSSG